MDIAKKVGFLCVDGVSAAERVMMMRIHYNRQELASKSGAIHDPLMSPGARVELLQQSAVVAHQIACDLDQLLAAHSRA